MTIEAFEGAYKMFRNLQTSPDFEHAGQASRGIRIQTESLVRGIVEMMTDFPEACESLILMSALIENVSEDYGTYVRVKGNSRHISVDVRGQTAPVNTDADLMQVCQDYMRSSGVYINIDFEGKSLLNIHSTHLLIGCEEASVVINELLKKLPEQRRSALADAFLNVVVREVVQSGEFLNF